MMYIRHVIAKYKNMNLETGVIRTFVPAKDFKTEQKFYKDLGFEAGYSDDGLTVYHKGNFSFYLQNYYKKEWAENFMMFMEVKNVDDWYAHLRSLELENKFDGIRFVDPVDEHWGRVCRLITPSGVLWHFATFKES